MAIIYSDVLPLKADRRDSISNLTYFGTSNLSCRQTNAVSFRVAVGRHVNVAFGCAMDSDRTK